MIAALLLLTAQASGAQVDLFADLIPERLGPGPHILVISDGAAMTREPYKTGAACKRARDAVRQQVAPPPNTQYVIHGPARIKAFCIPK